MCPENQVGTLFASSAGWRDIPLQQEGRQAGRKERNREGGRENPTFSPRSPFHRILHLSSWLLQLPEAQLLVSVWTPLSPNPHSAPHHLCFQNEPRLGRLPRRLPMPHPDPSRHRLCQAGSRRPGAALSVSAFSTATERPR